MPPIWRLSDEQWATVEPVLAEHDPPKRGPKRVDQLKEVAPGTTHLAVLWNAQPAGQSE